MEDLKPPYLMLSNHMHFIDFELAAMGTWSGMVTKLGFATEELYLRSQNKA